MNEQRGTHSTGVHVAVDSYSLDAHLATCLDHLMRKHTTLTLMLHSIVNVIAYNAGDYMYRYWLQCVNMEINY